MSVVVDTSVLSAFVNPADPRHDDARTFMTDLFEGVHGQPFTSPFVLSEGLALLRKRPGREAVSRQFAAFFQATKGLRPVVQLASFDRDQLARAVALHVRLYPRGLSLTDCALLLLAEELGAPVASFDAGFDGLVDRIGG